MAIDRREDAGEFYSGGKVISTRPVKGGVKPDWNAEPGTPAEILNKPEMMPPTAHVHAQSDVTGLDVALSGKADKSEMSVTPGTGANADKTTIQLKNGTSATVLAKHQELRYQHVSPPIQEGGFVQLVDRTINRVAPAADNTTAIELSFPDAVSGKVRDFLVLVTNTTGNTGAISFIEPYDAIVYGDGFGAAIASGETWLFMVTEVAANTFIAKSQKMEVAS